MPHRPISEFMTEGAFSIGLDQTIAEAGRRMRAHRIRHLPVLDGGRLVGLLSERDIALIDGLPGVDPDEVSVEEAMSSEPYTVLPSTPLDEVVRVMAEKKLGSAIVAENARVVGVFTTVDALTVLGKLLA